MLLALDMIGLIPGVPGVHGAVEERGPGEREWYLKSLEWYAPTELLLRDTLDCLFIKDGWVSHLGSTGAFLQQVHMLDIRDIMVNSIQCTSAH